MLLTRSLGLLSVVALFAGSAVFADSLYDPSSYRALVSPNRAAKVGDILTVLIVENATATASADTTTDKTGSAGAKLLTSDHTHSGTVQLNEDFKGSGKIQRAGKLVAQISVQVQAVRNDGYLQVKGDQLIDVNNEKQRIAVEGWVRPDDIAPNNTVISTRLADARISYVGDGILGEKQRPGFISRFLSWLRLL